MDKRTIMEIIQNYLKLLGNEGILIDKAFLYGSYSTNSETENSDIDLLIVSKEFDASDDLLIGKIWYLANKINSKIEPYIVSSKRFNSDESSPLIQLVKQEGIAINYLN